MSIFRQLFGTKNVVEKGIDMARDTGDVLIQTEEEKTSALAYFLKLYEPFKIAQRLLAMIVIPTFMLIAVLGFTVFTVGLFSTLNDEKCSRIPVEMIHDNVSDEDLEVCAGEYLMYGGNQILILNKTVLGEPALYIILFYFGGGLLEGGVRAYKRKNVLPGEKRGE